MSVLIKGMEMPERCDECSARHIGLSLCTITLKSTSHSDTYKPLDQNKRPTWCPLVPLPEKHGRLIDADATMKQWGLDKATKYGNETAEQQHFSYSTMMMYEIVDILDDAPVIIEAEGEE